jgi:hypothetical protein
MKPRNDAAVYRRQDKELPRVSMRIGSKSMLAPFAFLP